MFRDWKIVANNLGTDEPANTDTIYAYVASMNRFAHKQITIPDNFMQWAHMKQHINDLRSEDWTHELIWELVGTDFRINTISQLYPVHYHVKELALQLEPIYDRQLKI
jgi:wyosine [tRNA(Phe)-imidazoG37] synthetase (radical SAM superfamily)